MPEGTMLALSWLPLVAWLFAWNFRAPPFRGRRFAVLRWYFLRSLPGGAVAGLLLALPGLING